MQLEKKCYYHPENILHNFCANINCALPLCPKCINIHLNQSTASKHHIQPLSQTKQMVKQQLVTSIQALQTELKIIGKSGQYSPQACLQEYTSMLQKYRQQAIQNINKHYDYIKRELFQQLKSKYSTNISHLIVPLEQNLHQMKSFLQLLNHKPIECLIKVISEQRIMHLEKFLQKIYERKNSFKMELPRLEGIEGDKMRIVPGNSVPLINMNKNQLNGILSERENYINQTGRYVNVNEVIQDDYDRINELEARLMNLRGSYYH